MYTTDGAHIQNYLHGNVFCLWCIYSNDQMVCIAMYLYYYNDSLNTCTKLPSLVKYLFPPIDESNTYIIADG